MARKTNKQIQNIKAKYSEWLSKYPTVESRKIAGVPTSKEKFAEKYGVSRITLWNWDNNAEFKRETLNQTLGAITIDEAALIIEALKTQAMKGNVAAAKLLLEWTGLYGKAALKQEPMESIDFSGMTDKELEAYLREEDDDGNDDSGTSDTGEGMAEV